MHIVIILHMTKGAQHLNITCTRSCGKIGMNSYLNPGIQTPDVGWVASILSCQPNSSFHLPGHSRQRRSVLFPLGVSSRPQWRAIGTTCYTDYKEG